MKVREYARHRGISHVAVLNAIKSGRLTRAITRDEKGRPNIDAAAADAEWIPGTREVFKAEISGTPPKPTAPADDGPAPVGTNVAASFAKARAVKENFNARMAQLEYEREAGKVVPADEVQRKWTAIASIARTKVLGIPSKAKQRVPELTPDQYAILETICREALEELSDGDD